LLTPICDHRNLHSFPTRRSSDLEEIKKQYKFISNCRSINSKTSVEIQQAHSFNNIGNIHYDKGDYETSLSYHQKALALYKRYYRSEEHTSELQSRENLVCRLLLE